MLSAVPLRECVVAGVLYCSWLYALANAQRRKNPANSFRKAGKMRVPVLFSLVMRARCAASVGL